MDDHEYSPRAQQILDAAERHMRRGGYDAVSYRDLASDVGIKSASVHHHFPRKAALGEAVVNRYAHRLVDALGAPDDPGAAPKARVEKLCSVYRRALVDEDAVCLCCVLGAEGRDLPAPVAAAVENFYLRLLDWTQIALESGRKGRARAPAAAEVVSTLQGAMVLAIAVGQSTHFDDVAASLIQRVS
ncbi:MAG: TetR/AcrR family transcriptional regulator [Gammaproteobacteria bacterium]